MTRLKSSVRSWSVEEESGSVTAQAGHAVRRRNKVCKAYTWVVNVISQACAVEKLA